MSLNVLHVLASDSSSNSIFYGLPVYVWLISEQFEQFTPWIWDVDRIQVCDSVSINSY